MINKLWNRFFRRQVAPYWIVLLIDCAVVMLSGLISYALVYSFYNMVMNFGQLIVTLLSYMPGFLIGMKLFGTYSGVLRFYAIIDFIKLTAAILLGTAVAYFFHRIMLYFVSGSLVEMQGLVFFLLFLLSTLLCFGFRMTIIYVYNSVVYGKNQLRTFVYGTHDNGLALAKSINADKNSPYVLSGFITDDEKMAKHRVMGARVYYSGDDLVDTMRLRHIKAVFVSASSSETFKDNTELINDLVKNKIKIMMQPAEMEWDGKSDINFHQLHEIDIEDLLPRDKIDVDLDSIGNLIRHKVVLITGGAGSIGYEMVKQVAKFSPERLVIVDQAETPMHNVRLYMAKNHGWLECDTIVASITNHSKMEAIFRTARPDYVFHAAAYKHVPMMEDNPSVAVQNNIRGTKVIADLAVKYGTKKFVMISTDKAVNPTNVMGCSKRICEIYCQSLNAAIASGSAQLKQHDGSPAVTQFITTRFGNVLGSNGSVIPLFKKQISQGGPVTVTHPDIIRYFMLIPEACRLVLEAGTMGKGGEIFVFDMGKPVRIANLAQRMIDLSGATGIEIKYTGLRSGEKLYEEVLSNGENCNPTTHSKIQIAKVREYPYDLALQQEDELYALSFSDDDMAIVKKMKEMVPEYRSRNSKYEVLDRQ